MRASHIVGIGLLGIGVASYLVIKNLSFAADQHHSKTVYKGIELIREYSIRSQSKSIEAPKNLDANERIRRSSGNYDAMCASCHLKPGVDKSELSVGLYPAPPNLSKERQHADPARDFWIIKHGVKGSGMPSWGEVGLTDDETWDLVAFVRALPQMNRQDYSNAIKKGMGHHHSH